MSRDTWHGYYESPQSLNAWAYGLSNPINYTDPSGLITCEDSQDTSCIAKAQALFSFAQTLKSSVELGSALPVEALAQLADRAAAEFMDIEGVMWGMTNVLIGVDPNSTEIWKAGVGARYTINPITNPYWIGPDWLRYKHDSNQGARHSEQGDWKSEYWDGTPNQAYHFWYFAAVQYYNSAFHANAANIVHDPYFLEGICGDDLNRLYPLLNAIPVVGPSLPPLFGETSEQDYHLSQKGMELGSGLWWSFDIAPQVCVAGQCVGPMKVPGAVSDPGAWIRTQLKRIIPVTSPSLRNRGPRST